MQAELAPEAEPHDPPGALESVAELARDWFLLYLSPRPGARQPSDSG